MLKIDTKEIQDLLRKEGYQPPMAGGGMSPVDPATGMPIDPAMAGGMPPMDPAMAGGMPPMDPAMAGGMPPMDPAMAGGMPPMDPAMAGGMPPIDPAMLEQVMGAMGGGPLPTEAGAPGDLPQEDVAPEDINGEAPIVLTMDDLRSILQEAIEVGSKESKKSSKSSLEDRIAALESGGSKELSTPQESSTSVPTNIANPVEENFTTEANTSLQDNKEESLVDTLQKIRF